jgi:peptidoglycan hydrolase-like protein with peptidoglycan-binding domain
VETRGCGFFADRRPVILFERHIFSRRTKGRFDAKAPDISNPQAGGYAGGVAEYERLERALALDEQAALMSASWGLGQVMGFHAEDLGYGSVEPFVRRMMESEDEQLGALAAFIQKNGLAKPLQNHDWATFAKGYNGPAYAKNQYDKKLASAYLRLSTQAAPDLSVREGQLLLMYLGFEPGTPDGALGPNTKGALKRFQAQQQLPITATFDAATLDALRKQHALLPRGDTAAGKPSSEAARGVTFAVDTAPAPARPTEAAPLASAASPTSAPTAVLASAPAPTAVLPSGSAGSATQTPGTELALSPLARTAPSSAEPPPAAAITTPAWTLAPRSSPGTAATLEPVSAALPESPPPLEASPLPEPLAEQLRQRLSQSLDPDIQAELSRVLVLRGRVAPELGAAAVETLDLCLTALLAEQPNLSFARDTRLRIASELSDRVYPLRPLPLLRSSSPATQVVLGLALFLLFIQGFIAFMHQALTTEATRFFNLPARELLLVGMCGAVGGAVSILMRLGDFEKLRGASRMSMLLQGFFKPMVGMYCGIFGFALMKSGVLPLQASTPESALYLYMSVSFLLGFSERLAQDVFVRAGEGLASAGGSRASPS